MAEQAYIVLTQLKRAGDKRGELKTIEPGTRITLDETEGGPLVDIGALRIPDPAPDEASQ